MSIEYGADDPRGIVDLDPEPRMKLFDWIREAFVADRKELDALSSYQLKHAFEAEQNVYVTNGQFKGAMLLCGFYPTHADNQYWLFKVKSTRELLQPSQPQRRAEEAREPRGRER
jgi:hypothetical protein